MIAFPHSKAALKVVLAALLLGMTVPVPLISSGPAEAGEYYTRKRVNGVWITGRFKRKSSTAEAASSEAAPIPPDRPDSTGEIARLDPAHDRPPPFQRAAEARQAMASAGPETDLSGADETRLLPLQRALLAKARAMAEGLSDRPRVVKAVTFDFETGVRRNHYSDGSVVEEPFDPTTGAIGLLR